MAYKSCTSCHGQGRVYFGEYKTCTTCAGTGTMWVADSYSSGSKSYKTSRKTGPSGPPASFEENGVVLLTVGTFGYVTYIGMAEYDFVWYVGVGIGFIMAVIINKLFAGPLNFLLTGIKFLIGISVLALIVYGIIKYVIPEFTS